MIDEESDRLNRFIEGLSNSDRSEPAQPVHLRAVQARRPGAGGAGARRDGDARSPRRRGARRRPAARVGRRGVDHRSHLHPARQRQQVRAGGQHDYRAAPDAMATVTCGSRSSTKVPASRPICVSACSRSSSGFPAGSRTIRAAAASASGCRSRGASSRRRPAGSGWMRRRRPRHVDLDDAAGGRRGGRHRSSGAGAGAGGEIARAKKESQ